MLSTFPTLLAFGILVPFIIRLTVAFFLFGIVRSFSKKILITNYFIGNKYPGAQFLPTLLQIAVAVSGFFILIGLFTQIAALVAIYLIITVGNINKEVRITRHSSSTFNYLAIMCVLLLFLGAGIFAFDLPL